ncbi:pre-mRNA-splicing factor 38B [Lingula anatina]|uniref:Pre-mRNA-splicing factor 38B n=1 Tax=Lingula anatina TaxID=7574 RepID=A0A1S3J4U8_LINAN|nr:pre-mRNA-splicing factor 38B [Lingula anatina]|eukprot:XP_013404864.1 pre-mRNA-splicing factor 38B [Lingula anatina]
MLLPLRQRVETHQQKRPTYANTPTCCTEEHFSRGKKVAMTMLFAFSLLLLSSSAIADYGQRAPTPSFTTTESCPPMEQYQSETFYRYMMLHKPYAVVYGRVRVHYPVHHDHVPENPYVANMEVRCIYYGEPVKRYINISDTRFPKTSRHCENHVLDIGHEYVVFITKNQSRSSHDPRRPPATQVNSERTTASTSHRDQGRGSERDQTYNRGQGYGQDQGQRYNQGQGQGQDQSQGYGQGGGRDGSRDQPYRYSGGRDQDRYPYRDQGGEPDRDQDRDRSRDYDLDRGQGQGRDQDRDRDRGHGGDQRWSMGSSTDRDQSRDHGQGQGQGQDRNQDQSRNQDRSQSWNPGRNQDRNQDPYDNQGRDQYRDRYSDRGRNNNGGRYSNTMQELETVYLPLYHFEVDPRNSSGVLNEIARLCDLDFSYPSDVNQRNPTYRCPEPRRNSCLRYSVSSATMLTSSIFYIYGTGLVAAVGLFMNRLLFSNSFINH